MLANFLVVLHLEVPLFLCKTYKNTIRNLCNI